MYPDVPNLIIFFCLIPEQVMLLCGSYGWESGLDWTGLVKHGLDSLVKHGLDSLVKHGLDSKAPISKTWTGLV